jgi:uncharacterized membrane protein YphA (DoxX/SURF4 family)
MIRAIARPLLSAIFISAGIDTLRNPDPRVQAAQPVTSNVAGKYGLPQDEAMLVKINAGVQVGAGILLALGKFRRLAALALIGSTIPTTYAGHRFWEEDEPQTKAQQQVHFLKNLGLIGGLLLAVVDKDRRQGKSSEGGGGNGANGSAGQGKTRRPGQAATLANLATAATGAAMTAAASTAAGAAGSAGAIRDAGTDRGRQAAKQAREVSLLQRQRAAERAHWAAEAGRRSALQFADLAATTGTEQGRRAAKIASEAAKLAAKEAAAQGRKSAELAAARAKAGSRRSR